jgi:hypothetical protein
VTGQWRALTLRQPHASRFAVGLRTIETRSWKTSYRGPLVLCAAAWRPPVVWSQDGPPPIVEPTAMERYWDCQEDPDNPGQFSYRWVGPLGAALVTCKLVDCVPIVESASMPDAPCVVITDKRPPLFLSTAPYPSLVYFHDVMEQGVDVANEEPYGVFTPGRFAWILADVEPLPAPISVRGRQGLWSSAELDAALADLGRTA